MSHPFGNLTDKSAEAIVAAQAEATRRGNPSVEPAHVALALLNQDGGVVPALLRRTSKSADAFRSALEKQLSRLSRATGGNAANFSNEAQQALLKGKTEAEARKDEYVSAEHI
jgi:ATP-dependent Clp protease ATP-binding subunit ClpB